MASFPFLVIGFCFTAIWILCKFVWIFIYLNLSKFRIFIHSNLLKIQIYIYSSINKFIKNYANNLTATTVKTYLYGLFPVTFTEVQAGMMLSYIISQEKTIRESIHIYLYYCKATISRLGEILSSTVQKISRETSNMHFVPDRNQY